MRKATLASAMAAAALFWGVAFASAQQFGTAAEARAMLDKAVTELKAGEAAALAKFNVKDDPLGQRIFDSIKEGTVSTVDYNFPKPGTTDPAPKESFVIKIGNQGCGVGYYK